MQCQEEHQKNTGKRHNYFSGDRRFHELTVGNAYDSTIVVNQRYGYGIIHGDSGSPYTSLYGYMKENTDTYPEWEGQQFLNQTEYGF